MFTLTKDSYYEPVLPVVNFSDFLKHKDKPLIYLDSKELEVLAVSEEMVKNGGCAKGRFLPLYSEMTFIVNSTDSRLYVVCGEKNITDLRFSWPRFAVRAKVKGSSLGLKRLMEESADQIICMDCFRKYKFADFEIINMRWLLDQQNEYHIVESLVSFNLSELELADLVNNKDLTIISISKASSEFSKSADYATKPKKLLKSLAEHG